MCELVRPALERAGPIEAWIIDDTGFPKKGKHSVGVARQYCGQLGKQDNCQAAVSLSIANRQASLPVRYRLYLPQEWADDAARRRRAYVPEEIVFETKPEIALEQLRWACKAGLPRGVVLLDAGYGNHTNLRTQISALGLTYAPAFCRTARCGRQAPKPLPPKRWSGRGRPPTRPRRSAKHKPVSVKELALALPRRAWQTVGWREGSAAPLSSRFARVRVRAAHHGKLHAEEWLLIEWPKGEKEPTKYWLSTCRGTSPSSAWSIWPSCAGASSATTRSSSRNSASDTSKVEAGAASTITPRCASQPTDSWSPSGRRFPPRRLVPPRGSRNLAFPPITDPEAPPIRTERHIPNSIATLRRRLIVALVRNAPRCPCCTRPNPPRRHPNS